MFTMPFGFFSGALTSGELSLFERPVTDAVLQSGSSDTTSTFGSLSGGSKWYGGVLAPNGNIYGIPFGSTTVLKIDPTTDTATTFGSLSGSTKWRGGVLAPNGNIYGIPYSAATVLKLTTGNYSQVDPLLLSAYQNKF